VLVAPLLLEFGWGEIAQRGMDPLVQVYVCELILPELSYLSSYCGSLQQVDKRLWRNTTDSRLVDNLVPNIRIQRHPPATMGTHLDLHLVDLVPVVGQAVRVPEIGCLLDALKLLR
jgi:hypothetical protein